MRDNHRLQFTTWHLAGLFAFAGVAAASLHWPTSFVTSLWVTSIVILLFLGIARAFALPGQARQFWAVFVIVLGVYFVFAHALEPREARNDHPAMLLSTHTLLWLQRAVSTEPEETANRAPAIPLMDPFGPLSTLAYTGGQTIAEEKNPQAFMVIGQAVIALSLAYCCARYSLFISPGE